MKTSLTIFPCVLGSPLHHIRVFPGLSFATKRIGPPCCTLFTFVTCFSLQIILSQNYLLLLISVLAENTILKTAYFLLFLVGFDTLNYRKDYDRSPILLGHHGAPDVAPARGCPPSPSSRGGEVTSSCGAQLTLPRPWKVAAGRLDKVASMQMCREPGRRRREHTARR